MTFKSNYFFSHHSLAFWNIRSHGEALRPDFQPSVIHAHCHSKKVLSGWGIIARCLPSGELKAVNPDGEPLGL